MDQMEQNKVPLMERRGVKTAVLIVMVAIVAGLVMLIRGLDTFFTPALPPRLHIGSAAPDFSLPGLDGRTVSLRNFRGKVVFLNIWATWCPTCRDEMPSMEKLYRELKGEGIELLAVSVDKGGARAVTPFLRAFNLSFPVLLDPEGTIARPYRVTGVPESFIINKEGIIEKIVIGPIDWSTPAMIGFFRTLIQKP